MENLVNNSWQYGKYLNLHGYDLLVNERTVYVNLLLQVEFVFSHCPEFAS